MQKGNAENAARGLKVNNRNENAEGREHRTLTKWVNKYV
jgi:hypothetical protein